MNSPAQSSIEWTPSPGAMSCCSTPSNSSSGNSTTESSNPPSNSDKCDDKSSNSLRAKNICPEICEICKDVATGYHYEVGTCNSCKTFFRRAVVGEKVFKCAESGDCYEDPQNRKKRACRSCRFERCVEAGMNPLAMNMPYPEKNVLVQRILRRRQTALCQPSTSKDPELKNTLCRPLYVYEVAVNSILNDLLYLDLRTEMLRRSVYNPIPHEEPGLHALLNRPNVLSSAKILKPMPNWPLKQQILPSDHPLLNLDSMKRDQIITRVREEGRKFWIFFDALVAVEYSKTFPFFEKLIEKDQFLLLKNMAMLCSNLTQSYYSYAHKSDSILLPDGTMPALVHAKVNIGNVNVFDLFQKLTCALIRIGMDHKEYVLLKALILCNPTIDGLSEESQNILTEERNKYSRSLLSYCLATKGPSKGSAHFTEILGIVDTMFSQVELQKNIYIYFSVIALRSTKIPLFNDIMEA